MARIKKKDSKPIEAEEPIVVDLEPEKSVDEVSPIEEIPVFESAPVPTKYKVNSTTGLWLRNAPVSGGTIDCMPHGSDFIEEKREGDWSYGTYEKAGRKGWACNKFFEKA